MTITTVIAPTIIIRPHCQCGVGRPPGGADVQMSD
jgi:hypothetical protein